MRELHVVAVSGDGRYVLLGTTKSATTASHRIRLDARLVAAVRGELPGAEPAVDLSPKEIQARLRAGEPAEHIARTAGVPVTRVERFAGPVAGEMARMVEEAREAYVVRGRRGRSAVPLGKAVAEAVTEPVTWSARREEDGRWRVAAAWHARGRDREAAWLLEPGAKDLVPVDPASAALGHVDLVPPAPRRTAAKKKPATRAATPPVPAPAPAKRKAAPRTAARPRLRVVGEQPPAAPSETDARDGVKSRASVPAWADVLLGTTPGTDR